MRRQLLAGALALAVVAAGAGAVLAHGGSGAASAKAGKHKVHPQPAVRYDPARFTMHVSNPWFPLKPGVTYIYRGTESGDRSRDLMHVTKKSLVIEGVHTRVVSDRLFLNGKLAERTKDYYAQDVDGNVWYFGEDTAELGARGKVTSREGTWRTGRKGAEAGIIMQAFPQAGDQFMQEVFNGHAEDHYQVIGLGGEIKTPYGHFGGNKLNRSVQVTKEWTPLEPKVLEHKYYVRGVGNVAALVVKGPHEVSRLAKIVRR